jgi:hypothetical protein
MSLLFDAVCNRLVPRLVGGILRDSYAADGSSYVAYPNPPSAFEFLDATLNPETGDVSVAWGENQAILRKNKRGDGYHSFLRAGIRDDAVVANEHETLDAMLEQAASAAWL